MRSLILLVLLATVAGCRSQKELRQDNACLVDSVARVEHHRTIATIDSVIRLTSFDFDTLEVSVERPVAYAEKSEIVRLRAVKGRVIDSRKLEHNQVEDYNRKDTVAYKQSMVESSSEHSATTRLYNPPSGTAILVVAIVIAGGVVYLFLRKR